MAHLSKPLTSALPVLALLACAFSARHALAADDQSVVTFTGTLIGSTCRLIISDHEGSSLATDSKKTIYMGGFSTSSFSGTAGQKFGPIRTIIFSMKSADGTSACTVSGLTKWNATLGLGVADISDANGGVLNNTSTAALKTNTKLALMQSDLTALPLKSDGTGTLSPVTVSFNTALTLKASYVYGANGNPTEGEFKATVPLTITYE